MLVTNMERGGINLMDGCFDLKTMPSRYNCNNIYISQTVARMIYGDGIYEVTKMRDYEVRSI